MPIVLSTQKVRLLLIPIEQEWADFAMPTIGIANGCLS